MKMSGEAKFNPNDAFETAKLCELSYLAEMGIRPRLVGYDKFKFISIGETQCFVVGNSDEIIVVFRGSQTEGDWAIDFNIDFAVMHTGSGQVVVHEGFYIEALAVLDEVVDCVAGFKDNSQKVYLTGHSLGAALAGMTSALFHLADIEYTCAYCFGMPRIGGLDFAKMFNDKCKHKLHRVVNQNDVVTRVPFRSIGYAHIGELVYIDEDLDLKFSTGFWYRFLQRFNPGDDGMLALVKDGVDDHDIKHYVEAMFHNIEYKEA